MQWNLKHEMRDQKERERKLAPYRSKMQRLKLKLLLARLTGTGEEAKWTRVANRPDEEAGLARLVRLNETDSKDAPYVLKPSIVFHFLI